MSAVFRAARGGLGGRKLQAVIIGLSGLSSSASLRSFTALGTLAYALKTGSPISSPVIIDVFTAQSEEFAKRVEDP